MPAPTAPLLLLDSPGDPLRRAPFSVRAGAADMVARFAADQRLDLVAVSLTLGTGSRVHIDGATADGSVFVEAHTVTTPLRDIDLALIVQDVFKLALVTSEYRSARVVVLVADERVRAAALARVAGTPAAGVVEILVQPGSDA